VAVGTENYPFDRLVRWVDSWLAQVDRSTKCLIQHGRAHPPRCADGVPYLPFEAFERAVRDSDVVVCHGGPGTIALVHRKGSRPIVVPRMRAYGEHVDDHQVLFARRVAGWGLIELAEDERRLHDLLDAAVAGRLNLRGRPLQPRTEAVERFSRLVDPLLVRRG
jgi:UDP-N-acetylglucosamine transferase subunit ALG13